MKSTLMLLIFLIYSNAVGVSDLVYAKTLLLIQTFPMGKQ